MTEPGSLARPVTAVVIGGSAGSVEALSSILPALLPDCGVAVFVVVHLPRERPSLLAEIFQPRCRVRVTEAQDKEPVVLGTIYFAPPDYHLLIDVGPQLALDAGELVHFSRPSIDVLFESAADAYADRLIGVVLSGANRDGARGLESIQKAGGLTLVQRPETAVAPAMPQAALDAAPGSLSLTVERISDLLRGISGGRMERSAVEGWARA